MHDYRKILAGLFIFVTTALVLTVVLWGYSEAKRHRLLVDSDFDSSKQESASPEEQLTEFPGGDVGYASDLKDNSTVVASTDSNQTPLAPSDSKDADDFEKALLWDDDKNSTDDESKGSLSTTNRSDAESAPNETASDATALASTDAENKESEPSLSSDEKIDDSTLASSEVASNDSSNSEKLALNETKDANSDSSLTSDVGSDSSLKVGLYDSTPTESLVAQDDVKSAGLPSNELYELSPKTPDNSSEVVLAPSNGLEEEEASLDDSNKLATEGNPSDDSDETSDASNLLAQDSTKTDELEPNDDLDVLPHAEVATDSSEDSENLLAQESPKTDELASSDDSGFLQPTDVATDSSENSENLLTQDLTKTDEPTPSDDSVVLPPADVATDSSEDVGNLLAQDLTKTDKPRPSDDSVVLPPADASTDSSEDSENLLAQDLTKTDEPTPSDDSVVLPPTDVATDSSDDSDNLLAQDLTKTDEPTPSDDSVVLPPENVATDSSDDSENLLAQDLTKTDELATINIPDFLPSTDVAADSVFSSNELLAQETPQEPDLNQNTSANDKTETLTFSDVSTSPNDSSNSDKLTSDNSTPTIETLPDGLGVATGQKNSNNAFSSSTNEELAASQEALQNGWKADRSESQLALSGASSFDSTLFKLRENESTNYYLDRWNALDQEWQKYLEPLSDEERLVAIKRYQSEMDRTSLVIVKRLAFATDLNASKRDGFFRLYASLLSRANKTAELTALLLEERERTPRNDMRLGFLEVLLFEARVKIVGEERDADGLLNLSKELVQKASTSNVKYFLRKTKYLADAIRQYDSNLGERTFSVICQDFANSQDAFRQNMPSVFAGEARFESLPGNELRLSGMSVDGADVDLTDYRGHTTLVVFTNSTCASYLDELTNLLDVYAKYRRAGFEIVEYNLDGNVDDLRRFVQTQNIPWTVVSRALTAQIDGAEFVNPCVYYGIANLPTAILLDKNGKVVCTRARRERLAEELAEIYPDVR